MPEIPHPLAENFKRFNLGLGIDETTRGRDNTTNWQPIETSGLPTSDTTPSRELQRELRSPIKLTDSATGQSFTGLKLNWRQFSQDTPQRVIVSLPEYNSPVRKGPPRYRVEELARQTGSPVLAINYPKVDGSSRFTATQKKALREDGDYGFIALAQLRALQAEGITDIDLVGRSMGAWAAASLAAHAQEVGITVHNLVMVDSPGVTRFTEKELMSKEFSEGTNYDFYLQHPYDLAQRTAGGIHPTRTRAYTGLARWFLTIPLNDPFGVERKAMAKNTLEQTLQKALDTNPAMQLQHITGSVSSISPDESNRDIMQQLQSNFPGRAHQSIFPGEPHLILENGKAFAATVKLYLH